MNQHDLLRDFYWRRQGFPNQQVLLESDQELINQLRLDHEAKSDLESSLQSIEPVEKFDGYQDLDDLYDTLNIAVRLHRAGRTSEAMPYLEASKKVVNLYEAKEPDLLLGTALFYRASALVDVGELNEALVNARYAVKELGRYARQNPQASLRMHAYADCLFGYILSQTFHPGKWLEYLARGTITIESWVLKDVNEEPRLLWALELLAEALEHRRELESAYFLRLELQRRRRKDALRVQAVFEVALALNYEKRAQLAGKLGLAAVEQDETESARATFARLESTDVLAQEVAPSEIHWLLQRHFHVRIDQALGGLGTEL